MDWIGNEKSDQGGKILRIDLSAKTGFVVPNPDGRCQLANHDVEMRWQICDILVYEKCKSETDHREAPMCYMEEEKTASSRPLITASSRPLVDQSLPWRIGMQVLRTYDSLALVGISKYPILNPARISYLQQCQFCLR